ncbi:hypothetical protein NDU88_006085 [Pleurodeles waltl]|uniref:Uncharacterized protein n=1 Tax=Pleurodeles waltl TaxID=8319 RepID=A0AAV7QHQ4_PLEWA|nr:hypothetical protein NDU88_006085 [Pleurodeles waltl]
MCRRVSTFIDLRSSSGQDEHNRQARCLKNVHEPAGGRIRQIGSGQSDGSAQATSEYRATARHKLHLSRERRLGTSYTGVQSEGPAQATSEYRAKARHKLHLNNERRLGTSYI